MTPKEKANELFGKYYSRIEHTLSEEYSPHERFIVKQCALIAVDEILETTKVKWATQRKFPNGKYKFWKGVAYKKYWQEVKQEIENL
jgi:hypothetical protein